MTWIRWRLTVSAVATLAGTGCATDGPSASELLSNRRLVVRAASDLDCQREPLGITPLDESTRIVNGCGRRATYVEICDGDSVTRRCTWLLNGAIRVTAP